jgi:hypothetical protein
VLVPVVRVGKMRVAVDQRLMAVCVAVARPRWHGRYMYMVVMRVIAVDMFMRVFNRFMCVPVFVPLRYMQRHADGHQHAGS